MGRDKTKPTLFAILVLLLVLIFQNCGDKMTSLKWNNSLSPGDNTAKQPSSNQSDSEDDSQNQDDLSAENDDDKAPSAIEITTHPPTKSFQSIARFEFKLNDADLSSENTACWIGSPPSSNYHFRENCSSPVVFDRIPVGQHTFYIRSLDSQNKEITASWDWIVTDSPDASQDQGPTIETPFGLTVSSDQTFALVTDGRTPTIVKVDTRTGNREIVASRTVGTGADFGTSLDITLSKDDKLAYFPNSSGVIELDLETKVRRLILGANRLQDIALHSDGKTLFLGGSQYKNILTYDMETQTSRDLLPISQFDDYLLRGILSIDSDQEGNILFVGFTADLGVSQYFKVNAQTLNVSPIGRSAGIGQGLAISADGLVAFGASGRNFNRIEIAAPNESRAICTGRNFIGVNVDSQESQAFILDRTAKTLVRASLQSISGDCPVVSNL